MPRKQDDPEQSKRFIEMAREIGAGERPKDFERVFKKVVTAPAARASKKPKKK